MAWVIFWKKFGDPVQKFSSENIVICCFGVDNHSKKFIFIFCVNFPKKISFPHNQVVKILPVIISEQEQATSLKRSVTVNYNLNQNNKRANSNKNFSTKSKDNHQNKTKDDDCQTDFAQNPKAILF